MNVKTKFKMGDTVRGKIMAHQCYSCANEIKEKIEEFEIENITIRLFSYKHPVITYAGACGLPGYFEEDKLEKVK